MAADISTGRPPPVTRCSALRGCCSSGRCSAKCCSLVLLVAGVEDPVRSRVVAVAVLAVVVALLVWGYFEAMRVPRVAGSRCGDRPGSGAGLDGLRVADDHRHPLRADRSRAVVGGRRGAGQRTRRRRRVSRRRHRRRDGRRFAKQQAGPLASVEATLARVYVTGNHEYFSEAQGWLDYMERIGWAALHNRHIVVERGGDRLVIAGVDDATAKASGVRRARRRIYRPRLPGADPGAAGAAARPPTEADRKRGAARASIFRSRATHTAARSGRSTSSSDWINQWCMV